jgi:cell wall-associated NlpC family hydrolase
VTRAELVTYSRTFLGVRFRLCGRDERGMDCIGLLIAVARHFGQEIEDKTSYTMSNPFEVELNLHLRKYSDGASIQPLKHGQIVKFRQAILPMHVGIVTLDGKVPGVINANMKKRKVMEEPLSGWRDLIMELREFRGVTP